MQYLQRLCPLTDVHTPPKGFMRAIQVGRFKCSRRSPKKPGLHRRFTHIVALKHSCYKQYMCGLITCLRNRRG
jgi:hypothetical protein